MIERGWTEVTGRRRGSKGGSKSLRAPAPTTTNRYNWRTYYDLVENGGGGNCWWQSTLQRYLISEGLSPVHAERALLKDGKRGAEVDKLDKLALGVRSLTVAALEADPIHLDRQAFDVEEQSAVAPDEIEKLATTVRRDIRNYDDWKNSILHPHGLGDDLAAELVANAVGMHDFAVVQKKKSGDDKYLRSGFPDYATNMVYYDYGHFRAVVHKNVSFQEKTYEQLFLSTVAKATTRFS